MRGGECDKGIILRNFFWDERNEELRVYLGCDLRNVLIEAHAIARQTEKCLEFTFNGNVILVRPDAGLRMLFQAYLADTISDAPRAPQMLCETCWERLTSDVLPASCTLTGLEEACCPRCWPLMTRRADGTLSRAAWDKAVAAARDEGETRAQELYEQYGVWVGE